MKQGFTIVELLATIAIMGLVIIISVPAYEGISKSIKEQNYNSKISMLTKSTYEYINKYHKDKVFDGAFNADGTTKNICYTIDYLIEKNVFSPDDKEGIGVTDPLNGGNLKGYLVANYNVNNYEVNLSYRNECPESDQNNIFNGDDL